ncbi:MAG: NAD(P)H-hydrate dehydratase [Atribacterota bacterium]|nr:NAD(P)H-hydrate dehydratase [Atribacterota bacterium]
MKIARVIEMQNMDEDAINKFGISDELLMENAGLSICQLIYNNFKIENSSFLVICGVGNNGGDGLVVARKLHSNGAMVNICILGNPEKYKGSALKNWQIINNLNISSKIQPSINELESVIKPGDIIIDAIFGTGLARNIEGYYLEVIQLINKINNPVISIDIPSGINGNTGSIQGIAVKADYTVTFGLPKIGNILYPGYDYCGKLYVSHISFPPYLYNKNDLNTYINSPLLIPNRLNEGHKGTFGDALFISGSRNYYGAPYFSSLSFLKSGGGYSRLAAPASIIPYIAIIASEVVFLPQKETATGAISSANIPALLKLSEKTDIVIIGPGLSLEEETQNLVRRIVTEINKPILIDGDGLTAISNDLSILQSRKHPTILTPHLGEMSCLTKLPVNQIKEDLINIVVDFAGKNNTITVLKGAHTLIAIPDGNVFINMTGNSGMASAGSGDVLTGTIAAMYTLGLPVESAARQGVLVHGLAGDMTAKKLGKDGMTARDIMESLPNAIKMIRREDISLNNNKFSGIEIIH